MEQNVQGLWDNYKKCNTYVMGIPAKEEREKKAEETFETIMIKLPQINIRHHTKGPGSSKNTK